MPPLTLICFVSGQLQNWGGRYLSTHTSPENVQTCRPVNSVMASPTTQHFLSGKRIAVSGGGVAGLAFVIGLRKQWPSTIPPPSLVIYERDTQDAVGREGYSLSLRSDPPGGLQALQKLGILDQTTAASIVAFSHTDNNGFCLWDREFKEVLKIKPRVPPGLPVGGTRIARSNLRRVLIEGASDVGCKVTWGVAGTGVSRREDGRLLLELSNGETDICDLLIAADGGNSKIRNQLRPDDKLDFRRIFCIGASARLDGPIPEPINSHYGMVISGTGTGLFVSPVDEHSVLWNMSWHVDAERPGSKPPVSAQDAEAYLTEARSHLHEFPPLVARLVEATDTATVMAFNAKDKAPFRHTDAAFPDVIYLGDANHAVSPFAGNGANVALNDGFDIAHLLCTSSSLAQAVKAYDDMAVPRSTKVWKQSHFNITLTHATGWTSWLYIMLMRITAFLFFRRYRLISKARSD